MRGQRGELGLEPHLVINHITDDSLINNSCMSIMRKTQLTSEFKGSVLSVVYHPNCIGGACSHRKDLDVLCNSYWEFP